MKNGNVTFWSHPTRYGNCLLSNTYILCSIFNHKLDALLSKMISTYVNASLTYNLKGVFIIFIFCFLFLLALIVCLFEILRHTREFLHSYGDVKIIREGLQILTYTRHSWSFSSEGSLACHTFCDTGHPFIMIISEDPWHSQLYVAERLAVELSLPVFT